MKKLVQLLVLLFIANACLPTLHPLYHSKDLVLIEGLSKWWKMTTPSDKSYTWHFEPNPDAKEFEEYKNIYKVVIASESDTATYAGGILKLGENYYLDLYLVDFESDLPLANDHLYPVHSVWKFEFSATQIQIYPFNSSWIRDLIKNNQVRIKYEETVKGIIVTAGTDELQSFVKKYGSDERAFDNPKVLEILP